ADPVRRGGPRVAGSDSRGGRVLAAARGGGADAPRRDGITQAEGGPGGEYRRGEQCIALAMTRAEKRARSGAATDCVVRYQWPRRYSGLIPAASITGHHFLISAC